jgi:hypothetical protein
VTDSTVERVSWVSGKIADHWTRVMSKSLLVARVDAIPRDAETRENGTILS